MAVIIPHSSPEFASAQYQRVSRSVPAVSPLTLTYNAWTTLTFATLNEDIAALTYSGNQYITCPSWATMFKVTSIITFLDYDGITTKTGNIGLRLIDNAAATSAAYLQDPLVDLNSPSSILYPTPWMAIGSSTRFALQAYHKWVGVGDITTTGGADLNYMTMEFAGPLGVF